LEDAAADYLELRAGVPAAALTADVVFSRSCPAFAAAASVQQMVSLFAGLALDAAFAR
jgi:hypothetical protein